MSRSTHTRRRVGRHAAALVLTVLAALVTVPATALADAWGPLTSSYDGIVRVTGSGTLTQLAQGSQSVVTACDEYADPWPVYGYTDFHAITSADGTSTLNYHKSSAQVSNSCVTKTLFKDWTYVWGYWTAAGACAQVGWPVPDSCTEPIRELHRP